MVVTAVQYLVQRDELRRMGATHVVALAPEGVLSFGSSVLDRLGVVHDQTEAIVKSLKSNDYAALRGVCGTRAGDRKGRRGDRMRALPVKNNFGAQEF